MDSKPDQKHRKPCYITNLFIWPNEIIFHQPRVKSEHFSYHHLGENSCEVAIIWPDKMGLRLGRNRPYWSIHHLQVGFSSHQHPASPLILPPTDTCNDSGRTSMNLICRTNASQSEGESDSKREIKTSYATLSLRENWNIPPRCWSITWVLNFT